MRRFLFMLAVDHAPHLLMLLVDPSADLQRFSRVGADALGTLHVALTC